MGDPGDFVSVDLAGDEVLCFDAVLQVFFLRELGRSLGNDLVPICGCLGWLRDGRSLLREDVTTTAT